MIRKENNYAFIDHQNLSMELKRCGWDFDYERFMVYLREKHSVKRAFLFVGFLYRNLSFYEKLYSFGYEFIFKPVTKVENKIKGNCDGELILHTTMRVDDFDKALVVTGDGDFHCLVEYLVFRDKLKLLLIPNRNSYSSLLHRFFGNIEYMNDFKERLTIKKKVPDKDGTL